MPMLEIEVVGKVGEEIRQGLAERLASRIRQKLDSSPGATWVRLHYLPEEQYSENICTPHHGRPSDLPVFVSLLMAKLPNDARVEQIVTALTEAVATSVERPPENIHVVLQPDAVGRVAFGGSVLR